MLWSGSETRLLGRTLLVEHRRLRLVVMGLDQPYEMHVLGGPLNVFLKVEA